MRENSFRHTAGDGAILHVYAWLPNRERDIRALLQIVHGMAEHAGRYRRLARALTAAGYAVYAHDQRGHGQTAASERDLGYTASHDGWNRLVEDVREINALIRQRHPDLKRGLLGHSMGSFITQAYIAQYGETVDAAVLSATDADTGPLRIVALGVALAEMLWRGSRHHSQLLTKMSFGDFNKPFHPARTDFDWLSRDEREVDAYIADPRCGFACTTQLWHDLLHGIGGIERPAIRARVPKSLPVWLLAGSRDPVSKFGRGPERLATAYRRAGLDDVSVTLYPDGRHEMFNESNRDEVTADLVRWLEPRLLSTPRPAGK